MKFLTIISALFAGSLALRVLQEDNTILDVERRELIPIGPEPDLPNCCNNGFAVPCNCPPNCDACNDTCC
ncbi:hypothetical protein Ptr902_11168 [Pyrenophora tritici-repentis]|nr:hypothetical protein Ptr902_11168 [Pyrenophora tritici-repentis]